MLQVTLSSHSIHTFFTVFPITERSGLAILCRLDRFLQRARRHTFTISAMAFQDCWNLSLERLLGCCIHVAQPDGRLIPFCSFNLTARGGQALHRPRPIKIAKIAKTPIDALSARRLGINGMLTQKNLEQGQMALLRHTLQHARAGSPLYRQRLEGIDIPSLKSRTNLAALPLMDCRDLTENGLRLVAVSQSQVARIITMQTSGSSGPAKRVSFTAADLAATLDFFHAGMQSLVGTTHKVLVLLPFALADSVGDLLLRALQDGGIRPLAACSCKTFLHYGATEMGLGGAVECAVHNGCHIRESDLLVEIIDPHSGRPQADGTLGEIVVTTLGREALPLIRYRTGDSARLERAPCPCGGITARLVDIRGRLDGCRLPTGTMLYSQDLDDTLYYIPGLLDYRIILDGDRPEQLHAEIVATGDGAATLEIFRQKILLIPAIRDNVTVGRLFPGIIRTVTGFAANHTIKRTILDLRSKGERYATCCQ